MASKEIKCVVIKDNTDNYVKANKLIQKYEEDNGGIDHWIFPCTCGLKVCIEACDSNECIELLNNINNI